MKTELKQSWDLPLNYKCYFDIRSNFHREGNGGNREEIYWTCPKCGNHNNISFGYEIYTDDNFEDEVSCDKCNLHFELNIIGEQTWDISDMTLTLLEDNK
jgi:hypothetical protein